MVDCFYQHAVGSERSIFNGCNMDTFCVRPKKQMRLESGQGERRRVEKRSEYGQVKMNGVWCKFKYLWGLNSTSRESERKGAARGKSREIFCKSKKLFYSLHFKPRFLFEAAFDPLACLTCTSIPHKLTHCIALSQSRRQQEVYWSRPHNKCQECGTKETACIL